MRKPTVMGTKRQSASLLTLELVVDHSLERAKDEPQPGSSYQSIRIGRTAAVDAFRDDARSRFNFSCSSCRPSRS